MELNWSSKVIKYVMFLFNLLFVISGIIILSIGVSVKAYYHNYHLFLDGKYFSLPNLLIATGSLIFIISFLGCCGAYKENWVMMMLFTGCLILIFILEFSAGIAGYVLRDKTTEYLKDAMLEEMKYYNSEPNDVTILWDNVQGEFECCGVNNAKEWVDTFMNIKKDGYVEGDLPWSCCKPQHGTVGPLYCSINNTLSTTKMLSSTSTTELTSSSETSSASSSEPTTATPETESPAPSSKSTSSSETSATSKNANPIPLVGNLIKAIPGDISTFADYYESGCAEGFGKYLKSHAVTLGGVGMALACIQLLGIVFSFHLVRKIKQGTYYST